MTKLRTVDWDAVVTSSPLNKDAAVARDGGGVSFNLPQKALENAWDTPPPMKAYTDIPANDLTNQRFQKLVVLGLRTFGTRSGGASWVCRCDCGRYACFSSKGLRAQRMQGRAMCSECDYIEAIKAGEHSTKEQREASSAARTQTKEHRAGIFAVTHPKLRELRDALAQVGVSHDDFVIGAADFVRIERARLSAIRNEEQAGKAP